MRAFLTGGTGFIGSHVARKLRARGDDVVALVRSPGRAIELRSAGVTLVEGDLSDQAALRRGMEGSDAVFHVAADYRIGVPASERPAMFEANVRGTERVLDEAVAAGASRIVYVSTIGVFGNTHEEVVDETYGRPGDDWLSYYDETKTLAHRAALARIASGAPILIAQPGGVYGPHDHSEVGTLIDQMRRGQLRFVSFPELGFNAVHVEDAADGILLVHDEGRGGESYVLGGEITRLGVLLAKVAALTGRKPPRITMPAWLIKGLTPVGPLVGRMMHQPPNLRELLRAAHGVTYWASDAKARRELGYAPRDLEAGLKDTLASAGTV
jgi:dihydroflavonol-4-reductase